MRLRSLAGWLLPLACACGEADSPADEGAALPRSELLKPDTCKDCHSEHYRQWSGSMHAYAASDPLFVAMNARGQRETNGALGDFCVRCHAPMAVREGLTTDGLNLDSLEPEFRGVTCYFCHNVSQVSGSHNAELALANDQTMRGGLVDPVQNPVHRAAYSPLADRNQRESAGVCGACHDIVTPEPHSVHLERTFAEWQSSLFNRDPAQGGLTCGGCHMAGSDAIAADYPGVGLRRVHDHSFPGVDLAITSFPELESQKALVERELDATLRPEICVLELPTGAALYVTLENVAAGHRWPSGAAQDRRAWVELHAYSGASELYSSGVVDAATPLSAVTDPDLWRLGDHTTKQDGSEAHMFWDVAGFSNDCSKPDEPGCTIPEPVTFQKSDPRYFNTHVSRRFPRQSEIAGSVDRVTLLVHLRPVGLDVIEDLVQSGDLADSVRDNLATHSLLPDRKNLPLTLEWTPALSQDPKFGVQKSIEGLPARCVTRAPAVQPK